MVKLVTERAWPEDIKRMKVILLLEKNVAARGEYEGYLKVDRNLRLPIVTISQNSSLINKKRGWSC